MKNVFSTVILAVLLSACGDELPAIVGCEDVGDIHPVCNMRTPEDIAALADGRHLLLAHFGGMEEGTGSLSLFDTHTETVTRLFPPLQGEPAIEGERWGDENCPPPALDEFSPHGTHLAQLADGRWRYLVVNHGGREAIEMFEFYPKGAASNLQWRGCFHPAPETFMNDVVGLGNGDVIYSRMFKHGGNLEMLKSLFGFSTGDLWRWNHETGVQLLPGTEAAQPNGLEISADNKYVYANMYMEKEVWKVNAETGETVAVGQVASGDNSAWGTDGRLWVASHTAGFADILSCFENQETPCGAAFEIVALDPETMAAEVVFSHSGAPMGAATVAVPQGERVYLGSFVGDRLISVPNFSPGEGTPKGAPDSP